MISFFTAGSWEKDNIFDASETNIWLFLICQSFKSTGWMADFGEYTPMYAQTGFDGRWWNEEYNEILHGYLPQDWASLNR